MPQSGHPRNTTVWIVFYRQYARFVVAQTVQRNDPGLLLARNLANVGSMRDRLNPGQQPPSPIAQTALPAVRSRRIARLIFALGVLAIGLWISRDFLLPVIWGIIIAVALWPLYDRLVESLPKHGRNFLAPLLFTTATSLLLIIPLVLAAV